MNGMFFMVLTAVKIVNAIITQDNHTIIETTKFILIYIYLPPRRLCVHTCWFVCLSEKLIEGFL